MIAILIASSSSVLSQWFGIALAVSVAAMGLGALSTWIVKMPAAKRLAIGLIVAILLCVVVITGETVMADGSYLICYNWWDYFPLCWLAFGDGGG